MGLWFFSHRRTHLSLVTLIRQSPKQRIVQEYGVGCIFPVCAKILLVATRADSTTMNLREKSSSRAALHPQHPLATSLHLSGVFQPGGMEGEAQERSSWQVRTSFSFEKNADDPAEDHDDPQKRFARRDTIVSIRTFQGGFTYVAPILSVCRLLVIVGLVG